MITVDEALYIADDRKDNGVFVDASDDAAIALAAEVRRLREENERQHFDILAMNQSLDLMREENERLRKDAEKLQDTPVRYVSLQHIKLKVTDANPNPVRVNVIAERDGAWLDMPHEKVDIMRTEMQSAIDAARGAK